MLVMLWECFASMLGVFWECFGHLSSIILDDESLIKIYHPEILDDKPLSSRS